MNWLPTADTKLTTWWISRSCAMVFWCIWRHQNDMVWRHWNDMVSTGTRPTTDVIKAKIKEEHDAWYVAFSRTHTWWCV
jgi:hypothetical protein